MKANFFIVSYHNNYRSEISSSKVSAYTPHNYFLVRFIESGYCCGVFLAGGMLVMLFSALAIGLLFFSRTASMNVETLHL